MKHLPKILGLIGLAFMFAAIVVMLVTAKLNHEDMLLIVALMFLGMAFSLASYYCEQSSRLIETKQAVAFFLLALICGGIVLICEIQTIDKAARSFFMLVAVVFFLVAALVPLDCNFAKKRELLQETNNGASQPAG